MQLVLCYLYERMKNPFFIVQDVPLLNFTELLQRYNDNYVSKLNAYCIIADTEEIIPQNRFCIFAFQASHPLVQTIICIQYHFVL